MTDESVIATARNLDQVIEYGARIKWISLDVTDYPSVDEFVNKLQGMEQVFKVFYLAAYHHPDEVERYPRKAWNTNVTALSYFINAMTNVESLFYPSTEMVYGESKDGDKLTEESLLKPVNRYGKQKIVAEYVVTTYGYNVVRFPVLMGPSLLKHKKHFYDVIVETLKNGQAIDMFADTEKTMIDFDTATKILVQLSIEYNNKMPKVLNICGDKSLTKYDVGVKIAEKHGLDVNLVHPVSLVQDKKIFAVKRPSTVLLDNSLLKKTLGLAKIEMQFD